MVWGWISLAWAGTCQDVHERHQAALQSDKKTFALEQIALACPSHVRTLNDLALAYEEKNRLTDAEQFYQKAIQADPNFPPPYAGLGDVLAATGSPRHAVNAYKGFLRLLTDWKKKGDPDGYALHESIYRQRLSDLMAKFSSDEPVSAEAISHSLSRSFGFSSERGLKVVPIRAEIDLAIRFNSGSATLLSQGNIQLEQVAEALKDQGLQNVRVVIEGHTDSVGSDRANLALSQRRADSVRVALIARGVDGSRIESKGRGESFPVADNGTDSGRALNRRVTFVNLGGLH